MRSALRRNDAAHIDEILRTNNDNLKRVSPSKDLAETGVQCSEPINKTRMNSMDLERQILNVTPPEFSNQKDMPALLHESHSIFLKNFHY